MPSSQLSGTPPLEIGTVQPLQQLWTPKRLMALAVVLVIAVALVYVLLVVLTYQVDALLRPI